MGEYSFRNFDVGKQFIEEFKNCLKKDPSEIMKCERKVRKEHRSVESGRLSEMGDKIHNFISHLDPDEVTSFKKKFPDSTKIANEYGVVEELRTF